MPNSLKPPTFVPERSGAPHALWGGRGQPLAQKRRRTGCGSLANAVAQHCPHLSTFRAALARCVERIPDHPSPAAANGPAWPLSPPRHVRAVRNAQRGFSPANKRNARECAAWDEFRGMRSVGRPSHFRMRSTNIFRGGEFCECSVRRIPARSTTWAWNDTRNLKIHTNLTKTPNPPNPVRIRHRIEKICCDTKTQYRDCICM